MLCGDTSLREKCTGEADARRAPRGQRRVGGSKTGGGGGSEREMKNKRVIRWHRLLSRRLSSAGRRGVWSGGASADKLATPLSPAKPVTPAILDLAALSAAPAPSALLPPSPYLKPYILYP